MKRICEKCKSTFKGRTIDRICPRCKLEIYMEWKKLAKIKGRSHIKNNNKIMMEKINQSPPEEEEPVEKDTDEE